jgi:hypothetical protein
MEKESDQVKAWKDVEARDGEEADHPSGKMRLPGRMTATRAAILSGYMGVAAFGAVTNLVPTIPCTWMC